MQGEQVATVELTVELRSPNEAAPNGGGWSDMSWTGLKTRFEAVEQQALLDIFHTESAGGKLEGIELENLLRRLLSRLQGGSGGSPDTDTLVSRVVGVFDRDR